MTTYPSIYLKPKKEDSIKRFHPWVFSGAIAHLPPKIDEGDVVNVYSHTKEFLGVGHYQIGSIAVRLLAFQPEEIDTAFYTKRLEAAHKMREALNLIRPDNNTYRLVHGEGDHIPGLIIDIYGNTAVVQALSVGIHKDRMFIVDALHATYPDGRIQHIYYKSEGTLPYKADIAPQDGYLEGGEGADSEAIENGLRFRIDWLRGQKTGFFIDQRDNRSLLEHYSQNRNVLNMFCYTGGFSVYAMRGQAKRVVSVDSSSKAIDLTEQNVNANFEDHNKHEAVAEDAFKYLKNIQPGEFDLIILDPPAFAKHRSATNNALQGYKRLNLAAFEKLAPNSILFTFSCSQVISKEQFRLAVFSAAAISGRKVRILHQLTQPVDHPINIYHPEGEYLKGLVLFVE